jgi:hypothetical protein
LSPRSYADNREKPQKKLAGNSYSRDFTAKVNHELAFQFIMLTKSAINLFEFIFIDISD